MGESLAMGDNKDSMSPLYPIPSPFDSTILSFCQLKPTWLLLWTVQSRHHSWDWKPLSRLTLTPLSPQRCSFVPTHCLASLLITLYFSLALKNPPIPGNCQCSVRQGSEWCGNSVQLRSEPEQSVSHLLGQSATAQLQLPQGSNLRPLRTHIHPMLCIWERLQLAWQGSCTLA